jgi:hypothetical protein
VSNSFSIAKASLNSLEPISEAETPAELIIFMSTGRKSIDGSSEYFRRAFHVARPWCQLGYIYAEK